MHGTKADPVRMLFTQRDTTWCATIGVKHRNLLSGGPVGVSSTATGNVLVLNYSTFLWQRVPVEPTP